MKQKLLFASLISVLSFSAIAGEGMWLPFLLSQNEAALRKSGLRLTAKDLYDANQASLKDAVVHFGGFCTGEVVSHQGLIFTNHHCGYDAIQEHSSVNDDLLTYGFWAKNLPEEKPNPGLFVDFIRYMEDVTPLILQNIPSKLTDAEKALAIKNNIHSLIQQRESLRDLEYSVKPIYYGIQYILVASERYSDVRLVGAPPSYIGKFGSDTDNWVWPRHTGDFSVFRVYASPQGKPAAYHAENVPLHIAHPLKISISGAEENDFTMVYGFPGRTEEYLPAAGVSQAVDWLNPLRIGVRKRLLSTWDSAMRVSPEMKIAYASKYASSANAYKKWIGVNIGIKRTGALQAIAKEEAAVVRLGDEFAQNVTNINAAYEAANPLMASRELYAEVVLRGWELAGLASQLKGLTEEKVASAEFAVFLQDFYKNYNPSLDRRALQKTLAYWLVEAPHGWPSLQVPPLEKTQASALACMDGFLAHPKTSLSLYQKDPSAWWKEAQADPVMLWMTEYQSWAQTTLSTPLKPFLETISNGLPLYMRGLMQAGEGKDFYPDANSTLRLASGKVLAYSPADGVEYTTHTTLDGMMAKYIPGDYEFDIHPPLRALYAQKDFGPYAMPNGQMPVCFIASNHTSGGNSGSPAFNARGELIGINFDRVWEGTMSDYYFDERICRNVMVDIRYVLFIIDKLGGASHLIHEMELVQGHSGRTFVAPKKASKE